MQYRPNKSNLKTALFVTALVTAAVATKVFARTEPLVDDGKGKTNNKTERIAEGKDNHGPFTLVKEKDFELKKGGKLHAWTVKMDGLREDFWVKIPKNILKEVTEKKNVGMEDVLAKDFQGEIYFLFFKHGFVVVKPNKGKPANFDYRTLKGEVEKGEVTGFRGAIDEFYHHNDWYIMVKIKGEFYWDNFTVYSTGAGLKIENHGPPID